MKHNGWSKWNVSRICTIATETRTNVTRQRETAVRAKEAFCFVEMNSEELSNFDFRTTPQKRHHHILDSVFTAKAIAGYETWVEVQGWSNNGSPVGQQSLLKPTAKRFTWMKERRRNLIKKSRKFRKTCSTVADSGAHFGLVCFRFKSWKGLTGSSKPLPRDNLLPIKYKRTSTLHQVAAMWFFNYVVTTDTTWPQPTCWAPPLPLQSSRIWRCSPRPAPPPSPRSRRPLFQSSMPRLAITIHRS